MRTKTLRGLLVAITLLCALATATPAQATFGPRGFAFSSSSTNSQFAQGGVVVRCPTFTLTEQIDADGRGITFSWFFSGNPTTRATCTESLLGSSVTVTTNGRISIPSTSSVRRVSASGDLVIPAGSSVVVRSLAGTRTFGAQTVRNCITFNQAGQTFNFRCTITDTGGNAATFTASTTVTAGGPITVS
jgi:hypothetical protein